MIPRETIDQIFAAVRIEEVVGEFVALKRRGVNLLGLCPFHNEKTPSFTVSPVKGIYKCFGCGKAGNAVNFIMEHEHFTYPEALRYLAHKYQIDVVEEVLSPEEQQHLNDREKLFILNQLACDFFIHTLHHTEEGKAIGLSYLKERQIRDDTINTFQIGYSPSTRDAFTRHAMSQGYSPEILVSGGFTIQKEERYIDRFHSRILFPIHSAAGRIIGFGGRILVKDEHRPKYLNSPETEIYNKSKTLYGLHFARNTMVSSDQCFLVEGYTDVIALHQAGILPVVASSGTSLTQDQIRLIKRYTSNITILYDGDPAGIKASFRGIDMILEEGMNVKILLFPDGEDPDSYCRNHHPAEVTDFIRHQAENFILFKTHLLLSETEGDPIRKATLVKEIVQTISLIPDGISRSLYIRECADLLQVPEQVLTTEVQKQRRKQVAGKPVPADLPDLLPPPSYEQEALSLVEPDPLLFQEKELIRLLLLYGNQVIPLNRLNEQQQEENWSVTVADFLVSDLEQDDLRFSHPVYQTIFNEYRKGCTNGTIPDRDHFLSFPDAEISRIAVDLIFSPYELSPNWEKNNIFIESEEKQIRRLLITAILSFKSKKLDSLISETMNRIKQTENQQEQGALLTELAALKQSSILINKELGRIITK